MDLTFSCLIFLFLKVQMSSGSMINIVPRDEWEAKPSKLVEKFDGPIPFVIIHHSYIPGACYESSECEKAMRAMQKFHQDDRGWNDIGYSYVIGGDGKIYEGRGFNVVGAHAPRYNNKSVGICLIGDWSIELPSKPMLEATQNLINYGVSIGIIEQNYTLYGHRQLRSTECPGNALYNEIQTWPQWSEVVV